MDELDIKKFNDYCKGRDCAKCQLKRWNTSCRRLAMAYKTITKYGNGIPYVRALLEMIYEVETPNWNEEDTTYEETRGGISEWEKHCVDKAIGNLLEAEE